MRVDEHVEFSGRIELNGEDWWVVYIDDPNVMCGATVLRHALVGAAAALGQQVLDGDRVAKR